MNKIHSEKINQHFLTVIEWIPSLLILQFLWLLTSLPLLTIGSASRTVMSTIYHYHKNEEKKIHTLFWQELRHNFLTYRKQDLIVSFYLLLLLIDSRIFLYWGGAWGLILMYASLSVLFLSIVMVSYRMLLQLERANEVPLFTAFILFFYQWKNALLQLGGTLLLLLFLFFLGPIYVVLVGGSSLLYLQTFLFFGRKEIKSPSKV